ncbi:MAG: PQQ-binding-like beta-propeller repeat protein [Verrucomicrobiales bacterium]|nr:PQQ-binding-like beta-propeller repeat protein [Verrucomicrobiales bacterium]
MTLPFPPTAALLTLIALIFTPASLLAGADKSSPSDFVEPVRLDPTLVIDLPYATENNFCKVRLYPVDRCFLRREVAESLILAQRSLANEGFGLKIWDGYRPRSVQYRMWEVSPLPNFVGDPKRGSKHNRGAAVDVTLVDLATGEELEMPTPYDEFSPRARTGYLKVSPAAAENRRRLQMAMRAAGFSTIDSEWWHFDFRGWERFPLVDTPLEELAERSDEKTAAHATAVKPEVPDPANWPRFRGNNGNGLSTDRVVPLEWSETKNLKWSLDLPGPGSSSPLIWGERVFVTSYSGYGDGKSTTTKPLDLVRHLHCVDLKTGRLLWTASEAATVLENSFEGFLPEHGYASNTPATDGERVYCFYGKNGVFAYDFEGNRLWSAPTGGLSSGMTWGSASSVVLAGDAVIVNAGDEARALLAFHKITGKLLWRMDHPMLEQTYNTPVLQVAGSDRTDLIVAFRDEIRGLDPVDGRIRWFSKSPVSGNLSGSPLTISENRIALFSGFPKTIGTVFRGGGEGDRSAEALLWESPKAQSYLPIPVEHGGLLYWVSEDGIASCARPENGELIYRERLNIASKEGKGMAFYASPILVGDHLIAVSRTAGTFVISAKPQFELVRINRIEGDNTRFQATPAVSAGHLILRSEKALYAIAK